MSVGLPTSVYPIVGSSTITVYGSTALADATPGGTWSSSSPSVATVTASGAVYGVSVGSAVISYSVTDTCGTTVVTKTITVTGTLSENGVSGNGLSVNLAPNPAAGFTVVNCSLGTATDIHITLRDLTGRILISRDAFINQSGSTGLSLPGLAPGVYIVEVAANGEKVVKMLMAD
jgi:hypothetical protein